MTNSEYNIARSAVLKLWEDYYKNLSLEGDEAASKLTHLTLKVPSKKPSILADHMRLEPRSSCGALKGEYERYCRLDMEEAHPGGHLVWWSLNYHQFP